MTQRELIPSFLPVGEISILGGASGAGKTTILFQLIKALQRGDAAWFGMPLPRHCKVGLIAADRAWPSYERLAHDVGVDLGQLEWRSLVSDPQISLRTLKEDPLLLLQQLMASLLPCDLIIVDPLIMFFGVDTNRYNLICAKAIELGRWTSKNNVTVLGTHHAVKARTDFGFKRPQDRISGSSAIQAFTSTQSFLETALEAEDGTAALHIFCHHAAPRSIKLMRRDAPPGLFVAADEQDLASEKVLALLVTSQKPLPIGEIAARSGLDEVKARKAIGALELMGLATAAGWGVYQAASSPERNSR